MFWATVPAVYKLYQPLQHDELTICHECCAVSRYLSQLIHLYRSSDMAVSMTGNLYPNPRLLTAQDGEAQT